MHSSGSMSFASSVEVHFCNCGLQASMKTSLTKKNLGRRFFGVQDMEVYNPWMTEKKKHLESPRMADQKKHSVAP
ncbi:hypothetical protein CJ030_MR7G009308 [Morella rubra]|uniref:Uncharacterized protein n=1 Tax=Morella rubra TaxID=262757 RepID=A0A6A1V0A6_9ROSI|nr:hypothetical protein CJ030_MR7G009308 [Morella rubra]